VADHVRPEIECIDRMCLNAFVPELQQHPTVTNYSCRI